MNARYLTFGTGFDRNKEETLMANTDHMSKNGIVSRFFASSEDRKAQREKRTADKQKQRDIDLKVAQDLKDSGYYNDHMPDSFFYRHYYF